jgi:lipopolysaccharide biosynthesis glycosyltransferase
VKIERIYIAGHKADWRFTQCCVASIRHWYPKIPITLIKDESGGDYSTEQLETYWNVDCFRTPRKLFGFGFGKLEPLFLPAKERCLILDSDIVFVGRVLDTLENYDEDFIVADGTSPPEEQPLHYYNIGKLNELDADFQNSNFTFNSGQIVATTGILKRADFEPVIDFSEPPSLRYPAIFAPSEQGVLNYVLLKKFQQGKISLRRVPFMWWAGWLDEKAVNVRSLKKDSPHPFLVHWAGPEKKHSTCTFDTIRNGHLLRHFESVYYSRIRNGPLEEKASPWRRIANVAADLRRRWSVS